MAEIDVSVVDVTNGDDMKDCLAATVRDMTRSKEYPDGLDPEQDPEAATRISEIVTDIADNGFILCTRAPNGRISSIVSLVAGDLCLPDNLRKAVSEVVGVTGQTSRSSRSSQAQTAATLDKGDDSVEPDDEDDCTDIEEKISRSVTIEGPHIVPGHSGEGYEQALLNSAVAVIGRMEADSIIVIEREGPVQSGTKARDAYTASGFVLDGTVHVPDEGHTLVYLKRQ